MKTELTGGGVIALAGVAVVGLLGAWVYANREAIGKAVQTVNPASDKNIIYQGVNSVTRAATGGKGASFGSWLYDLMNPNQPDPTAPAKVGPDAWDRITARKGAATAPPADDVWQQNIVQAALGESGRPEYALKMTPETFTFLAAASVVAYAATRKHRRKS